MFIKTLIDKDFIVVRGLWTINFQMITALNLKKEKLLSVGILRKEEDVAY